MKENLPTRRSVLKDRKKIAYERLRAAKSRKGITLVELAIVLLVLGVIMGIVYASIDFGVVDSAKAKMLPSAALQVEAKLMQFDQSVGIQLSEGQSLEILGERQVDAPSYLPAKPELIQDLWGRPYFICYNEYSERHVCTYGQDGQPGGEGQNADFMLTDRSTWPQWLKGGPATTN